MVVGVSCSVVGPKRYERWGVSLSDFAVSVDGSDLSFMIPILDFTGTYGKRYKYTGHSSKTKILDFLWRIQHGPL